MLKVAVASNTLNMSQIFRGELKRYESSFFKIQRNLCKAVNHKQLLLTYKKSKTYLKGINRFFVTY